MNDSARLRPREVTFLPPLSMPLTFLENTFGLRRPAPATEKRKKIDEKSLSKLIEKLSEKEK